MREILFKAKRIDNGEWVEGYVFDDGIIDSKRMFVGGFVITEYKGTADDKGNVGINFHEVNPDTVCQYTGLTDTNGNKIWENDIVEIPNEYEYFLLEWEEDTARFVMNGDRLTVDFDNYWSYEVEVIGNAFDNPELLEGGSE